CSRTGSGSSGEAAASPPPGTPGFLSSLPLPCVTPDRCIQTKRGAALGSRPDRRMRLRPAEFKPARDTIELAGPRPVKNGPMTLPRILLAPALLPPALAPAEVAGLALPKGVPRAVSIEGVTEYRLANGLRILLIPDPSIDT